MAVPLPDQAFLQECFDYHRKTGALIWRHRPREHFATQKAWNFFNQRYAGEPAGGISLAGYRLIYITGTGRFWAARIIWRLVTGDDPGPHEMDHKNRCRDDDRWRNLRIATRAQNMQNKSAHADNHSGLKGVSLDRRRGNWKAGIQVNRVRHHLGCFDSPEAAHAAYRAAAQRLHGAFARGN